jgi:hypothetical protein
MNDVSRLFLTEDITIITGFMSTMDNFLHSSMDDLWKEFLFIRNSSADLMIDYLI